MAPASTTGRLKVVGLRTLLKSKVRPQTPKSQQHGPEADSGDRHSCDEHEETVAKKEHEGNTQPVYVDLYHVYVVTTEKLVITGPTQHTTQCTVRATPEVVYGGLGPNDSLTIQCPTVPTVTATKLEPQQDLSR